MKIVWIVSHLLFAFLLCLIIKETSSQNRCSVQQERCHQASLFSQTCERADEYCRIWISSSNSSSAIDQLKRYSPWSSRCPPPSDFCPLSFQCIIKGSVCNLNTIFRGNDFQKSPSGQFNCSVGQKYCVLSGGCIQNSQNCSFTTLANVTMCNFNSTAQTLFGNDSSICPTNQSFCYHERKCKVIGSNCTSPSPLPAFHHLENETGWNQFCRLQECFCPKIILTKLRCDKFISKQVPGNCSFACSNTPIDNCTCLLGQYNCYHKGGCINNTIACEKPVLRSVCIEPTPNASLPATPIHITPSLHPGASLNVSANQPPMIPTVNLSLHTSMAPAVNLSLHTSMALTGINISGINQTAIDPQPTKLSSLDYLVVTPTIIPPLFTPYQVMSSCNYTCEAGFYYCPLRVSCVEDGHMYSCFPNGSCPAGYKFCAYNGSCINQSSICASLSLHSLPTPRMENTHSLLLPSMAHLYSSPSPSIVYMHSSQPLNMVYSNSLSPASASLPLPQPSMAYLNSTPPFSMTHLYSLSPPNISLSHSLGPPNISLSHSLGPPNISLSHSLGPPNISLSHSLGPPSIRHSNSSLRPSHYNRSIVPSPPSLTWSSQKSASLHLPTPPSPVQPPVLSLPQRNNVSALPLKQVDPPIPMNKFIAIVNLITTGGNWWYSTSGSWSAVPSVNCSSAFVMSPESKLRYTSQQNSFHGLAIANISFVSNTSTEGQTVNVCSQTESTLFLVVFPGLPTPNFTQIIKTEDTMDEDAKGCRKQFHLNTFVSVLAVNFTNNVKDTRVSAGLRTAYQAEIERLNHYLPKLRIVRFSTNGGVWFKSTGSSNDFRAFPNPLPKVFLVEPSSFLCFKPDANFFGKLSVVIAAVLSNGSSNVINSRRLIELTVNVRSINDRPSVKESVVYLKEFEYNASLISTDGFKVGEFSKKYVTDPDGGETGVAVVNTPISSYGSWQYNLNCSTSWTSMLLQNNTTPYGKVAGSSINLLLLKPNDCIRFTLSNIQSLWTRRVALQRVNFAFFAWDMSDNQTSRSVNLTIPSNGVLPTAYSRDSVLALQLRKGCDGKLGTTASIDSCGLCGGDNSSCKGCDNVLRSGAVIDDCGNCTKGNTNLTFNFRLDCANECGTSFKDTCLVCQRRDRFRNFTDCNGDCFGKARISKCGICVGGSSGSPITQGMDLCGKCGGNNSTCTDCGGVPNGVNRTDICGSCLNPNDTLFDSECVRLADLSPFAAPNSGGFKLKIAGAGLKRATSASCYFVFGASRVAAANTSIASSKSGLNIITPSGINAGFYELQCSLGGLPGLYNSSNKIQFYSLPSLTSFSSNETRIGRSINITVTGSGFPNTSSIICITNKGTIDIPATYVSNSSVICHVPAIAKSLYLKVSISFSSFDRSFNNARSLQMITFDDAPLITSCKMRNNLQGILCKLDKDAQPKMKSKDCSYFLQGASGLGSRAKCKLLTPSLFVINLRGRPTIAPGASLTFRTTQFEVRGAKITKYANATQIVNIMSPAKTVLPKALLEAPVQLGPCAILKLIGTGSSGGGGRPLNFKWSAEADPANSGSLTGIQQAAINDLNTTLSALPAKQGRVALQANTSLLNIKVKFTIVVTNFLDQSASASVTVTRVNKDLPILFIGSKDIQHKASLALKLKGKVVLSRCLPGASDTASKLSILWESDTVGVTFHPNNRLKTIVKKGTLKGGKTYRFTLTVTIPEDPSLFTSETVVVTVLSSPLKVIMRVPNVIGADDTLILNAARSYDPDNIAKTESFEWDLQDSAGNPLFIEKTVGSGQFERALINDTTGGNGKRISISVRKYFTTAGMYQISCRYRKGLRETTVIQKLTVKPGAPPIVSIRQPKKQTINPSDKLTLPADIKSKLAVSYTWSCVEESGFGYLNLSQTGISITPVTASNIPVVNANGSVGTLNIALKLNINVLFGGIKYRIKLSANNVDDSSEATYDVETNSPPTEGTMTVSPISGNALEKIFTLSAEEQGWSDDADQMPLTYLFGFYAKDKRTGDISKYVFGSPQTDAFKENVQFPPGDPDKGNNITVFVEVSDIFGATSRYETVITVNSVQVDDSKFNNASQDIQNTFNSGDMDAAFADTKSLLLAASSGNSNGSSMSDAEKNFKESVGTLVLDQVEAGAITDELTKQAVTGTCLLVTEGGLDHLQGSFKEKVTKNMKTLSVGSNSQGTSKRKRRAVSTPTAVAKTAAEVEQSLGVFTNVINVNDYTTTSNMNSKSNFFQTIDQLLINMCAGITFGESPAVAKSTLAVLQSYKKDFANLNTNYVQLGCSNCSSYISASSQVLFGETLKTTYSSWACTSTDTCSGTCITSAQMPADLKSTSKNASVIGHVVYIRLVNPETSAGLIVNGLASPVTVNVTLNKRTNGSYQCHTWDSTYSKWVQDGITNSLQPPITTSGGVSQIACNTNKLGFITVLEGPAIVVGTTSIPPTTSANNSTNATIAPTKNPALNYARTVRFTLQGNCSDVFNSSTKAAFTTHLKQSIASKININVTNMPNFNLTCGSIIVGFTLTPDASNSATSVNDTITSLSSLIKSGNFVITLADGRNLTADQNSLVVTIIVPPTIKASTAKSPTTKAPTTKPANKPPPKVKAKGLGVGSIVGIVIGCLVGIVIIAIISYLFCFRKKTRKDPTVGPNQHQNQNLVEMKDRNNDGTENAAFEQ